MKHGNSTAVSTTSPLAGLRVYALAVLGACLLVLFTPHASFAEDSDASATSTQASTETVAKKAPSIPVGSALPSADTIGSTIIKSSLYCVGILLLGFALLKRFSPTRESQDNPITVIAKKGLGPKNALLLVEVFDKQFLLGATGENISLITAIEQAPEFSRELAQQFEQTEAEQTPLKRVGA